MVLSTAAAGEVMGGLRQSVVAGLVVVAVACGDASPAAIPAASFDPDRFCDRYQEVMHLSRTEMLSELAAVAPPELAAAMRRAADLAGSIDDDIRIDRYLGEHCG